MSTSDMFLSLSYVCLQKTDSLGFFQLDLNQK